MVSEIIPKPDKDPRRVPVIGYLADTYSDHAAFPSVCIQVNEMMEAGIEVTEPLIDHLFQHSTDDWLTTFRRERMAINRERQTAQREHGYTYFMQHGDRIKIGYSINPRERAVSLSLRESNIIGVIQSLPKFERVCHDMWADIRIGNTEWFYATEELVRWIGEMANKWHYKHPSRKPTGDIQNNYRALLHAIYQAP